MRTAIAAHRPPHGLLRFSLPPPVRLAGPAQPESFFVDARGTGGSYRPMTYFICRACHALPSIAPHQLLQGAMTRNSTIARHWACALLGLGAAWAAAAANRPYPATAAPCNTTLQACIDAADSGDTIVLVSDGYIAEDVLIGKNLSLVPGQAQPSVRSVTALASTSDVRVAITGLTSRGGASRVRGLLAPGGGSLTLTVTGSTLRGDSLHPGLEFTSSTSPGSYGSMTGQFDRNTIIQGAADLYCAPAISALALSARMQVDITRNDVRFSQLGRCAAVQLYSSAGSLPLAGTLRANLLRGSGGASAGILLRVAGTRGSMLRAVVVNNLVASGEAESGVELLADGPDGVIEALLLNNTVAESRAGIQATARTDLGARISGQVANNLLAHHAAGAMRLPRGLDLPNDHNLVYASGPLPPNGYQPHGPHTRYGNPAFADRAQGDYRLLATSDAIDRGDDSLSGPAGSHDASGDPRRVRTLDIGAYEFLGAALPPDAGADLTAVPALAPWGLLALAAALGALGVRARRGW